MSDHTSHYDAGVDETAAPVPTTILARATICFGGLQAGEVVSVDPDDEEIARYFHASILVPLNPETPDPGAGT